MRTSILYKSLVWAVSASDGDADILETADREEACALLQISELEAANISTEDLWLEVRLILEAQVDLILEEQAERLRL